MKKISKPKIRAQVKPVQECPYLYEKFKEYFKIGVSPDFILLRDDFPITTIFPSDLSRLCIEMFRRNDEVFHGK